MDQTHVRGHEFEGHIADPLARGWYDHDWDRLGEIDMLGANGLRGDCRVFDLGAHQNVVAMMWAKEVGPSGTVISVEASRHNVEVGQRNGLSMALQILSHFMRWSQRPREKCFSHRRLMAVCRST